MSKKNVLLIVGPTAVGKTKFSLEIAEQLDGEIISADSRQVYKYMDIGTAKPTPEERKRIKHHFIDIKYPDEYYSAGKYGREARRVIHEIFSRGKRPIVVGGSGFYVRALVDGLCDAEISNSEIKQILKTVVQRDGLKTLYEKLIQVDPVLAERIHPNDTQRILRALEVWELTGVPLSQFQQERQEAADFNPIFLGLTMDRKRLYQRIEQRVDNMIELGLVQEVVLLKEKGYSDELISLQTVGYQEVFQYLKGNFSYENMISLIKQKSRHYAKRQLTWFRKDERINWFDAEKLGDKKSKILLDFFLKKS